MTQTEKEKILDALSALRRANHMIRKLCFTKNIDQESQIAHVLSMSNEINVVCKSLNDLIND